MTSQLVFFLAFAKARGKKKKKSMTALFFLPCCLFVEAEHCGVLLLSATVKPIPEVSVGLLICVLHCPDGLCLSFALYLSPHVSRSPLSAGFSCITVYFYRFFFSSLSLSLSPNLKCLKGLITNIHNPYKLLF